MHQPLRLLLCLLLTLPVFSIPAVAKPAFISIIIDDIGNNLSDGQRAIDLPGALTYSVLPFTPHGKQLAKQAHQRGKEIMLHMPMDNSHGRPLGPGGLTFKQTPLIFKDKLEQAISETPYISGLNNHMGSGLTSNAERMQWLMKTLKEYPLYFVDSRTSVHSVAAPTAKTFGIPTLERDIFLDHEATKAFTAKQFKRLIKKARKEGSAIAIGHPYPSTLDYLENVLPHLDTLGVELVSPSQLLSLKNTPLEIAEKTPPTGTASDPDATSPGEIDLILKPTPTKEKARNLSIMSTFTADEKPGHCRITEQLDVTHVTCS